MELKNKNFISALFHLITLRKIELSKHMSEKS